MKASATSPTGLLFVPLFCALIFAVPTKLPVCLYLLNEAPAFIPQ